MLCGLFCNSDRKCFINQKYPKAEQDNISFVVSISVPCPVKSLQLTNLPKSVGNETDSSLSLCLLASFFWTSHQQNWFNTQQLLRCLRGSALVMQYWGLLFPWSGSLFLLWHLLPRVGDLPGAREHPCLSSTVRLEVGFMFGVKTRRGRPRR